MIAKTSILGIKFDSEKRWIIDPPQGRKDNVGYAAPFPIWWKKYNLKGTGFVIGEDKEQRAFIRTKLELDYSVFALDSVSLENADYNINITQTMLPKQVNFILCMAVLEHVVDVGVAIRHMSYALTNQGLLCISVPYTKFKQHRYPIDCYRFLEDAMQAFAEIGNLTLLDYTRSGPEWCSIYRKDLSF